MIKNSICPYCGKKIKFTGDGNDPFFKSCEHLIPNSIFSIKRGNGEADFFAHRKCNADKSQMDSIIGLISKSQSYDHQTAVGSINKSVTSNNKKRFEEIYKNSKTDGEHRFSRLPFSKNEILSYINYLAKGLYYKKKNKILNLKINIVIFSYLDPFFMKNHINLEELKSRFSHENIMNNECIIINYLRNEFYIFFHSSTGIYIQILKKNKKNIERQKNSIIKFV